MAGELTISKVERALTWAYKQSLSIMALSSVPLS